MYFSSFLKVNGNVFGIAKISNILLGCSIFLIFIFGKQ